MGIIYSKLKQYARVKIENVKASIRNKVEDVKLGVRNRINNTRDAINDKVNQVVTSCKNCVRSTKEDIIKSVVEIRDGIYRRIRRTRDSICDKCLAIKSNIFRRISHVRNSVISAKDRLSNNICDRRDWAIRKYENAKNSVRTKYREVRNAKLSRWQKVYFSALGFLISCILYVLIATLFNMYTNDYDQIELRFAAIWEGTKVTAAFLYEVALLLALHVWQMTCFLCQHSWRFSRVAWIHSSECLVCIKRQLHDWSKEGVLLAASLLRGAGILAWSCILEICRCAYLGLLMLGDYTWRGTSIAASHLWLYSSVGLAHTLKGTKAALSLMREGAGLACCEGSATIQRYGPQLLDYLVYFATDFRHASVEALELTVEFLREAFTWSISALCSCTSVAFNLTLKAGEFASCFAVDFAQLSYEGSFVALDLLRSCSIDFANWSYRSAIDACMAMEHFVVRSYELSLEAGVALYEGSLSAYEVSSRCLGAAIVVVTSWYDVASTFITNHLLVWLSKATNLLLRAASMMLTILFKFFGDLGFLLFRFFSVTFERVYSATYTAISLLFGVAGLLLGVIRLVVGCLVITSRGLFGATIWSMVLVGRSYTAFLDLYNGCREVIFFLFLALLSIYCSSVARDRRESLRWLKSGEESEYLAAVEEEGEAENEGGEKLTEEGPEPQDGRNKSHERKAEGQSLPDATQAGDGAGVVRGVLVSEDRV